MPFGDAPSGVPFVEVALEPVDLTMRVLPVLVDSWNPTLEHDIPRHLYKEKKELN
jgi:hypothetical protein